MALNHGSSGGVDCVDVKYVLEAFEHINKCRLSVQVTIQGQGPHLGLVVEMFAYSRPVDLSEVRCLASQRLIVGSVGPRTMEAAILQGLYSLDAQMAAEEFAKADKK